MLAVLKLFRVLMRSMDTHYRQVERRSRLGGAQLWALAEIASAPQLTIGDLAGRMAIHVSTASNLVRRLEGLGLVARRREPGDRRRVALAITAAGRRRLNAAPKPTQGLLQEALASLPRQRISALEADLEFLLARMRHIDKRGSGTPISEILEHHGGARARR